MSNLFDLPLGFLQDVARFLPAKDVLSFVSTNTWIHQSCPANSPFWKLLREEHYHEDSSFHNNDTTTKQAYLLAAHRYHLPLLKWHRVETRSFRPPAGREGHVACRLGNFMILTGGFTDDRHIYVKPVHGPRSWTAVVPTTVQNDGDASLSWVYGATLTALDDTRAVRFGGFRSGGYSNESSQVALLTITEDPQNGQVQASWRVITCETPEDDDDDAVVGRAYHSSLLLFHRYLFVVGGMQDSESTIRPMLLDTETWTWYTNGIVASSLLGEPTGRHGASLISDIKRDRLLLFGGGSGRDLLRSGQDNAQVWQVDLRGCNDNSSHDDLMSSLPWHWHCVHNDDESPSLLEPVAKLNLGRCHEAAKIQSDIVMFAFGSGRPSCNSLLGYNLEQDRFITSLNITGSVPQGRFTLASIYLEDLGYWVFHGGFSSTYGETLGDTCVLDVLGGMRRPFTLFPVQRNAQSFPLVSNEMATSSSTTERQYHLHRGGRGNSLMAIMAALVADRRNR